MSQVDKLIKKLLSKLNDFCYKELNKLLHYFGYEEVSAGMTSGSRVAFAHGRSKHIIRLHKPHPGNVLKQYQLQQIIAVLKSQRLL